VTGPIGDIVESEQQIARQEALVEHYAGLLAAPLLDPTTRSYLRARQAQAAVSLEGSRLRLERLLSQLPGRHP